MFAGFHHGNFYVMQMYDKVEGFPLKQNLCFAWLYNDPCVITSACFKSISHPLTVASEGLIRDPRSPKDTGVTDRVMRLSELRAACFRDFRQG